MRRAAEPMSAKCSTTWTPASRRAAIFPSAVATPREMMAPAWWKGIPMPGAELQGAEFFLGEAGLLEDLAERPSR